MPNYEMIGHLVSDAWGGGNKGCLCADRLSNLNSLKRALSTGHKLYICIHEEDVGAVLSL